MPKPSPRPDAHGAIPTQPQTAPRTVSSDSLLRGAREVHITHRGRRYRLLETRSGKLLLNG
ncbi:MAG: hypothetical protein Kow0073_11320 [Immundisolibacter sp.]